MGLVEDDVHFAVGSESPADRPARVTLDDLAPALLQRLAQYDVANTSRSRDSHDLTDVSSGDGDLPGDRHAL